MPPTVERVEQLEAFPGDIASNIIYGVHRIPIHELVFDPEVALPPNLQASIEEFGVLVPLLVQAGEESVGGYTLYQVVDGERRAAAALEAGMDAVPCTVINEGGASAERVELVSAQATLISNLSRSQNIIRELQAIERLMAAYPGRSPEGIADHLGISRRMVQNRLRLRNLLTPWRRRLMRGQISLQGALVIAQQPHSRQREYLDHVEVYRAVRPTIQHVRQYFGVEEPAVQQASLALNMPTVEDPPDGVGFDVVQSLIDRVLASVPDPASTDDPPHVQAIIFHAEALAEMVHAMMDG